MGRGQPGGHPGGAGAAADQPTSAAQTAPGHMLGGLPLGHSVNAGSGINNALRVPARAYAIPRTPAAG